MPEKWMRPGEGDPDFGFLNDAEAPQVTRTESGLPTVNEAFVPENSANDSSSPQNEYETDRAVPVHGPAFPQPGSSATRISPFLMGYAISITILFLTLLLTGRISLSGHHPLESLPDVRPLAPKEFRKVPDGTELPAGHALKLGESRRFGDVVVTPLNVTRDPLAFQGFLSGEPAPQLTTKPVLKLWLRFKNVSNGYGFPPFDAGLMSHRSPDHAVNDTAVVNSLLTAVQQDSALPPVRVLNFLHSMDNYFVITGQESARVIMPGEELTTFIASSEAVSELAVPAEMSFIWRVQFRKGIHERSGNGVTTLIDVSFAGSAIAAGSPAVVVPAG